MGLFDFLFKSKTDKSAKQETIKKAEPKRKRVTIQKLDLKDITESFDEYVALDLETTGLDYIEDEIAEIGLIRFRNGSIVDRYDSLIAIDRKMPSAATKVNHITNKMLEEEGRSESIVYKEVIAFMEDVLEGKTILVAHNAKFDFDFLLLQLNIRECSGTIRYLDTLEMSRKLLNLESNRLQSVANHFNIKIKKAHRADADAEACGLIFRELITIQIEKNEKDKLKKEKIQEKKQMSELEKQICAVVLDNWRQANYDISKIRFYKNSSNHVDIIMVSKMLQFKIAKKGMYFVIPKKYLNDSTLKIEECTKAENSNENNRVYFENYSELIKMGNIFNHIIEDFLANYEIYHLNEHEKDFFASASMTDIAIEEIDKLLESAVNDIHL